MHRVNRGGLSAVPYVYNWTAPAHRRGDHTYIPRDPRGPYFYNWTAPAHGRGDQAYIPRDPRGPYVYNWTTPALRKGDQVFICRVVLAVTVYHVTIVVHETSSRSGRGGLAHPPTRLSFPTAAVPNVR